MAINRHGNLPESRLPTGALRLPNGRLHRVGQRPIVLRVKRAMVFGQFLTPGIPTTTLKRSRIFKFIVYSHSKFYNFNAKMFLKFKIE